MISLSSCLQQMPLIAILRGVRPEEVLSIGQALYDAGLRCIEVPLNSPDPFKSIEILTKALPNDCLIGAGTVLKPAQVKQVADVGGRLIVMPHSDGEVIRAAKAAGLFCTPGVATPTEAFAALGNGADGLKLFPAEQLPPIVMKAWRAVISPEIACLPVGGITVERMDEYWHAGASGFGLGSALYKVGDDAKTVASSAKAFALNARKLQQQK